jgi:hypothetical protein
LFSITSSLFGRYAYEIISLVFLLFCRGGYEGIEIL